MIHWIPNYATIVTAILTSLVPEYSSNSNTSFRIDEAGNSAVGPCEEFYEYHDCPSENSVLVNGECIWCTSGRKTRLKIDSKTCKSRPRESKSFGQFSNLDYNNYYSTEFQQAGYYYECPTTTETILKQRVKVGAQKLNGFILKVVTIQREPFSKVNGENYSGVVFEYLNVLRTKYNFSTSTFLPYDGNWGNQEKNGTWNGMLGQILRQEADIGAAPFSVTLERLQVVDFTVAYHEEPTAILIPAPNQGEKLTVVVRPLSKEVWLSLFVTMIILIPTFYILHICTLYIRKDVHFKKKSWAAIVGESLMFMTGSLVQESVISPVNKTTRFLIALWWMSTLILANIYMAFLVSYLSVPKLYNIVDSLENLAHQSELKWTFRKGTAHQSLFKSGSSTGIFKLIGDNVADSQLVLSDYDGVKRVLSERMAFIKEKSFLDVALGADFKASKKCRMTLAKEDFFTVGLAFAIQKKSPFLNLFNFEISNAQATGLLAKWKTMHWPSDLWCTDAASFIISTQPPTRKLMIDDLQGAFFILGCGLLSGAIGFVSEQLYFRKKMIRLRLRLIASSSSSSTASTQPLVVTMT